VESVNGRFRDECLNEHLLSSLVAARRIIEAWRDDYNIKRAHTSLNGFTPAAFATRLKGHKGTRTLLINEVTLGAGSLVDAVDQASVRDYRSAGGVGAITVVIVEQNVGKALAITDCTYVPDHGHIHRAETDIKADPNSQRGYTGL